MTPKYRILAYTPGNEFLLPYFIEQFKPHEVTTRTDSDFTHAVMVSTTDVYNAASGCGHDEDTPLLERHSMLKFENEFIEICRKANVAPAILRCPHIVGTGMKGLPREMVNKIYRGTFFHIKGVEERLSVVHATDVVKAASKCLGHECKLIVSDGNDPTYAQLAEALAYRLGQKRIFTISERWARWRYNSALYNRLTESLTFSSRKIQEEFNFKPTPVCEYLTTHVYDDESL